MSDQTIITGDALETLRTLPADSFNCCVTSPPYWRLIDYGVEGQLGLERAPWHLVERLVEVFDEVRRCLTPTGVLWLNVGDSYAGSGGAGGDFDRRYRDRQRRARPGTPGHLKPKDLAGFPWLLALALQKDGWWLRVDVVWEKYSRPVSAKDRPERSHEYLFLLSKRRHYDLDASALPQGSVWRVYVRAASWHPAAFPESLILPCILSSSRECGRVLDPFAGSGTVGAVCRQTGRGFVGIELHPGHAQRARERIGEAPVPASALPLFRGTS